MYLKRRGQFVAYVNEKRLRSFRRTRPERPTPEPLNDVERLDEAAGLLATVVAPDDGGDGEFEIVRCDLADGPHRLNERRQPRLLLLR